MAHQQLASVNCPLDDIDLAALRVNTMEFFICFKRKLFIYKNLCKLLQVLPIGETDQLVSELHPSRRDIFAHLCVVVSLSHIQSDSQPANLPVSHSVIH